MLDDLLLGKLEAVEARYEELSGLLSGGPPHAVPAGVVIAGVSIVVLALLSHHKRKIGARIPSGAVLADGWLSATGCLLAVVTVAGTAASTTFGWWWADPAAASVVAVVAIGLAVAIGVRQRPNIASHSSFVPGR